MSVMQKWFYLFVVCDLYPIGMKFFFKQYRHVTKHLLLYLTNCFIFFLHNYPAYCYCVSYSCQCPYLLKYDIYTYCRIWSNQLTSHELVFFTLADIMTDVIVREWVIPRGVGGPKGEEVAAISLEWKVS